VRRAFCWKNGGYVLKTLRGISPNPWCLIGPRLKKVLHGWSALLPATYHYERVYQPSLDNARRDPLTAPLLSFLKVPVANPFITNTAIYRYTSFRVLKGVLEQSMVFVVAKCSDVSEKNIQPRQGKEIPHQQTNSLSWIAQHQGTVATGEAVPGSSVQEEARRIL
jgi:hypothetical protein